MAVCYVYSFECLPSTPFGQKKKETRKDVKTVHINRGPEWYVGGRRKYQTGFVYVGDVVK